VYTERGFETGARHAVDEREWREERPSLAALLCGHQRLECFAEHFRVDGGFAPRRRFLARRESILSE
jgi:hypothetical protein